MNSFSKTRKTVSEEFVENVIQNGPGLPDFVANQNLCPSKINCFIRLFFIAENEVYKRYGYTRLSRLTMRGPLIRATKTGAHLSPHLYHLNNISFNFQENKPWPTPMAIGKGWSHSIPWHFWLCPFPNSSLIFWYFSIHFPMLRLGAIAISN